MRTKFRESYPMRLEEILPCASCGGKAFIRNGESFEIMHEYHCPVLVVKGKRVRAYSKHEIGLHNWNIKQRIKRLKKLDQ